MTSLDTRASTTVEWLGQGRRVAAAILIEAIGSSPLSPGATMLIDADGNLEGSVTGGCVEAALAQEAREVLEGGSARTVRYGVSDELAGTVGLTCGGTVEILVHALGADCGRTVSQTLQAVTEGKPAVLATVIDGAGAGAKLGLVDGRVIGNFDAIPLLESNVARDMAGALDQGQSSLRSYGLDGATMDTGLRVFIRVFTPPPRMVIFGASDFSAALAPIAREVGYHVTICDAREPFVQSARFGRAAEVAVDWPKRFLAKRDQLGPRDAVLVFTHDPKFDEPAIAAALASEVGYIGALGSRRTVAERTARLRERGVTEAELERIYSPCGLDIGARTPEETAVSIIAEMIAIRTHRAGGHLRESADPVHADVGSVERFPRTPAGA